VGARGPELKRAIDELRELARGIHPAVLTEEGLPAAVESLAERSAVPVRVAAGFDTRLPEPVETVAYFVVSESLANVAKYARASGARIALSRCNGTLRVEIVDDGIGGADASRGSGLRGLEDRVSAVRGSFRVQTRATGNPCPSRDPLRHLNRPADGEPAATPGAVASDHLTARPRTLGIDVTFRKGGSSRLAALVRTVGAGGVGALGATFRGTCAARTFRGAGRYRGCDR
jgi:hypothetical protein